MYGQHVPYLGNIPKLDTGSFNCINSIGFKCQPCHKDPKLLMNDILKSCNVHIPENIPFESND